MRILKNNFLANYPSFDPHAPHVAPLGATRAEPSVPRRRPLCAPLSPSPPPEWPPEVRAAAGKATAGPTSLLFPSSTPRDSLGTFSPMASVVAIDPGQTPTGLVRIHPWGGQIRALGVRICPPRVSASRRPLLAASAWGARQEACRLLAQPTPPAVTLFVRHDGGGGVTGLRRLGGLGRWVRRPGGMTWWPRVPFCAHRLRADVRWRRLAAAVQRTAKGMWKSGRSDFCSVPPFSSPCSSVGAVWRVTWWPAPWGLVGARGSAMVVGLGWPWPCSVAPWGCCRVRRATSLVLLAICVARRQAVTAHHSAPRGFCRGNPSHLGTMSVAPPASCPS